MNTYKVIDTCDLSYYITKNWHHYKKAFETITFEFYEEDKE